MIRWGISGLTAITPREKVKNAKITIQGNTIEKVTKEELNTSISLEIENGIITPGLINSHDHLLGNYFPKVGNGPYENWLPWDNDLKSAPVYRERQQIENRDLYLLGGYRNLISGTTSVQDLIPHFVQDPFLEIMPIRVISDFALAHSITSFALAWGDGITEEYRKAEENDIPFVTHAAEGFDSETVNDIKTLDSKGGLGEYSVLVHCLALSDKDIQLIKERDVSVVWCADSNMFMYNKTANIKKLLESEINVCIGTDSPMSGGLNILYEMKFDRDLYKKLYSKELPDEIIIKMATMNPAKAFRLRNLGQLKPGYLADIAVFADKGDPYDSVVSAELKDVLLVVIDGRPVYGNMEYKKIFDAHNVKCQEARIDGVDKVISGDIIGLLKRISKAVRFKKEFPFLPVEFDL